MTMLCTLIRGQMSYTFFQLGAHVLLCQLLGGQMSSYAIFHRGADVRGGKCPTLAFDITIRQTIKRYYRLMKYSICSDTK